MINDINSNLNQVFSKDYNFSTNANVNVAPNGLKYWEYSGTYALSWAGSYVHSNSSDPNFFNILFNNNPCRQLGKHWRLPMLDETIAGADGANGVPAHSNGNTWTATPDSGTTDEYIMYTSTPTTLSQVGRLSTASYLVCVTEDP